MESSLQRKIIHIDMDAFYASVEQRDRPELKGKPIAVGGSPAGRGGVVATASYEARKFGVKSAMSSKRAQQLCPELLFIKPRFDVYKEVSDKIRDIFFRYTDLVEPLSLDEAFLDVSDDKQKIGSAIEIARRIRRAIREELYLTASAGVSVNKFVAKIASDYYKPNGLTFIGPSSIGKFMETLPVEKFYGVGKVTATRMKETGIFTGADLKKFTERQLIRMFGKPGRFFYHIVRGIDNRPVQPFRESKSISAEDTFPFDLEVRSDMYEALERISSVLCDRIRTKGLMGRTVTLKIKFADFRLVTRSHTFPEAIRDDDVILQKAKDLLDQYDDTLSPVRLLGIGLSAFDNQALPDERTEQHPQLKLFPR